jgi:hypothetical protein
VMATVWEQPTKFLPAYRALQTGEPPADKSAAASMQALFRRVRELDAAPR